MMDFKEWATIVSGFSGLLSFIYVVYDKVTSGPKIVSQVTSATVYEKPPSEMDKWYNYDFAVEVEIGNIGTKLTSILKPSLEIFKISINTELYFSDNNNEPFNVRRRSSIALESGFADSYVFRYSYRTEHKLELRSLIGRFEMKQIKGKYIRHKVLFKELQ